MMPTASRAMRFELEHDGDLFANRARGFGATATKRRVLADNDTRSRLDVDRAGKRARSDDDAVDLNDRIGRNLNDDFADPAFDLGQVRFHAAPPRRVAG